MENQNIWKMEIRELEISNVKESEFNPRVKLQRGSDEYEKIKDSIEEFGFVEPIVVNDVNMCCLGGTQRLQVAIDMGARTIPSAIVHIEDQIQEKKLCIALNKIKGDWDMEKLAALLVDDNVSDFFTGFDEGEIDLSEFLPDGGEESLSSILEGADEPEEESLGKEDEMDPENQEKTTQIIISSNYKFRVPASRYYDLIESLRDIGMFEKKEIVNELKRRLMFSD